MINKKQKAVEITAKLHALLHTAEWTKGEITYLDVSRICGYLHKTYFSGGLPDGLRVTFESATQACMPSTLEKINRRNLMLGVMLMIPGGILALTGFGSIKSKRIVIPEAVDPRSWPGKVWDWIWRIPPPETHPPGVNWDGIVFTVLGIILIAIGIYLARRRANPKYQASVAERIIHSAINQWGDEATAVEGKTRPLIEEAKVGKLTKHE